ncbi:MAG: hypothetical protein J4G13_02695 [Dehalococcoidia bacterium]|nr:hypothetical protein [Dehalococcoidia bacterium]
MEPKAPDRHQLAVAILAIATAAIGFGLFGSDLDLGELTTASGLAREIQWAKLIGAAATTVFYFMVLITVGRMLSNDNISGRQLTNGPIMWLYMEMISLAWIYFVRLMEDLGSD